MATTNEVKGDAQTINISGACELPLPNGETLTRGEFYEVRRAIERAIGRERDEFHRLESICHFAEAAGHLGKLHRLECAATKIGGIQ